MDLNELKRTYDMADPTTTTTGSALLFLKGTALLLPVFASAVAFWLGLRFVPLRKGNEWADVINRLMACFISSVVLGTIVLVSLYHHWPHLFTVAQSMAVQIGFVAEAGFFMMTGCVLLLCSIPGPWLVAAVFLWLDRRKNKDIAEIINELKKRQPDYDVRSPYNRLEPWARPPSSAAPPQPPIEDITCEGCATGSSYESEPLPATAPTVPTERPGHER